MTYPTPKKPGFYWAKIGDVWLVANVVDAFWGLGVRLPGRAFNYEFSDFTFGPEVVKPDDLEDDK